MRMAETGGRLFVAMKFDFSSEEDKKTFFLKVGAAYKAVDLQATINTLNSSVKESSKVTFSAYQIGGNTTELPSIFGKESPVLSCSLSNFADCVKAMDEAIKYTGNVFSPSVPQYPQVLDFTSSSYVSAGVPLQIENASVEIIRARVDLANRYEQQYADWMLAESWLGGTFKNDFTPEQKQYLMSIKGILNANLEVLRNAGLWCFSDLNVCLGKYKTAISTDGIKNYDKDWLYGIKVTSKKINVEETIYEQRSQGTGIGANVSIKLGKFSKECAENYASLCLTGCKDVSATLATYSNNSPGSGGYVRDPYPTASDKTCYRVDVKVCTKGAGPSKADYSGTLNISGSCPVLKQVEKEVFTLEVPQLLAIIGIL